jgi:hypothetical protein
MRLDISRSRFEVPLSRYRRVISNCQFQLKIVFRTENYDIPKVFLCYFMTELKTYKSNLILFIIFQHSNPILKFLLQWFDQSSTEHDGLLIEQLACIVISRLIFLNLFFFHLKPTLLNNNCYS